MGLFGEHCVRCGKKTREETPEGLPTCEECQLQLQAEREEKRTCPLDGSVMSKEIVQNIIIDRCPSCGGVWLDSGELELVKKAMEESAGSDLATAMVLGMMR
ncbi:MAG: zf-TFIIB domain-containing protein [Phycisphaerae bacterium]|nr:zf-TFIIB domain-containing protein [Phycisphaerae bacterium]